MWFPQGFKDLEPSHCTQPLPHLPLLPYSLLPTPYSLLPTPYSLLPIPYSLLPTPYSLLPIKS
ncbi:hypothetical protein BJP34_35265 [Moorena producens PAL-8-15-08-1]|uniref:Uncharacterized protein n=1 Tax=Moorena producens PAL-8-15-08-1 TaxID=1458985 RepID=A0A1D8U479_9CYAN|nr:hypothetical protein BJP34_35265 [Moorena producens PAL-8-15-08-1]